MMVGDGKHHIRVRFTESESCTDGFRVPRNAAGYDVYAKGILKSMTISQDHARHYAEDEGKSKEEIEKIVGDQQTVEIFAAGVLISDGEKLDPPVQ